MVRMRHEAPAPQAAWLDDAIPDLLDVEHGLLRRRDVDRQVEALALRSGLAAALVKESVASTTTVD